MAGDARPHRRARRRRRGRTCPRRHGGLGRAAARAAGRGRAVGRRHVLAEVDLDDVHAAAAPAPRARPRLGGGTDRRAPRARRRAVAAQEQRSVLRRRRPRRASTAWWSRSARTSASEAPTSVACSMAARRAARRRRMELRGARAFAGGLVQHDDPRARGAAGGRALGGRRPDDHGGPRSRRGVPPRATAVPIAAPPAR